MVAEVDPRVHITAARIASNDPEMDRVARDVAAEWRAQAAKHTKTGDYSRSIRIIRGRLDRIVTATDPAALSIEYGHAIAGEDGETRHVPGLHLAAKTAAKFPRFDGKVI